MAPRHIYNGNFFLEPLKVVRNVCLALPLWSHWNNWTKFSACQLFFIVCDTLLITFYLNLLSIFFFILKVPFGFYLFQIPGSILTFKDNETIEAYSKLLWWHYVLLCVLNYNCFENFRKILKEILAMMSLLQACNWVNQVAVAVIIRIAFPVNFAFVSSKFKVWKFKLIEIKYFTFELNFFAIPIFPSL